LGLLLTVTGPEGFLGPTTSWTSTPTSVANADGPEVWYTDAFGRNGQTGPFPGSIRQRLSKMDNKIGVDAGGPVIGNNRNYAGGGVHAPN
jgi:hypothetical protein